MRSELGDWNEVSKADLAGITDFGGIYKVEYIELPNLPAKWITNAKKW